ncbi:Type I restriction enzyme, S subunit [Psychrobacter arenosus]|uniref:restriction endonuclease subunit S n=1 Tax=Psychrobacter arenosus TaxID=256326 RepID=UPI0039EEB499
MSDLSYMDKLLDGVEVEWMALGKALVRTKGTNITAGRMKELHKDHAPLKIFAGGKTVAFVDFKDIPEENINREPSIIVKSRGVVEFEYYTDPFSHKNEMWSYHSKNNNINIKYVYYYLKTKELYFQGLASRMQMPQIATPDTDKFQIPIPPLSIQAEIVQILDSFTELTTELTAELTAELIARRQQYAHYRDQLLTFKEGEVEWKALNKVCSSISAGGDLPKNFIKGQTDPTDELPYPIFANATGDKGLYGFTDKYKIESDAVTISARGAKVGYHTVREGKFTPIIRLITLVPNKNIILTRYLNYILDMTPIAGTKGGIPQLTVPTVKKIAIPVPPLAEQARIVAILDKFDALTTSLTEGLPREIALRQQQYEYYRELLLSFPKAEVADHD